MGCWRYHGCDPEDESAWVFNDTYGGTPPVFDVLDAAQGDVPGCHASIRKRVGELEDEEERVGGQVHGASSLAASTHFGAVLCRLRLQRALPQRHERLDALALVYGERSSALLCAGLALQGYHLELEAYHELEAGRRLPDDPVPFLDALSACLGLSVQEEATLLWQYAYDLLRAALGGALASELLCNTTVVEHRSERLATDAEHNGSHRS